MTRGLPAHLRADCSACVGLCCVVPPFDVVQGFGFDKPADEPCRHLCADHRCGIHADLMGQGFEGCVAFDCLGAGQRVTAQFDGASWRERPELAAAMFAAYRREIPRQQWLAKLTLAAAHAPPERAVAMQALAARIDAHADVDADGGRAAFAEAQALLAGLRR
jgi:hypothetical protein